MDDIKEINIDHGVMSSFVVHLALFVFSRLEKDLQELFIDSWAESSKMELDQFFKNCEEANTQLRMPEGDIVDPKEFHNGRMVELKKLQRVLSTISEKNYP